jgi:hypothetical protein
MYRHKMLAYICLAKSGFKDCEDDKEYSVQRFEVFMVMLLKILVFRDVAPCHWGRWSFFKKTECLGLQESSSSRYRNILLLLLDSEVEDKTTLSNVGNHSPSDTSHPRSPASSVFNFSIYLKYSPQCLYEGTEK